MRMHGYTIEAGDQSKSDRIKTAIVRHGHLLLCVFFSLLFAAVHDSHETFWVFRMRIFFAHFYLCPFPSGTCQRDNVRVAYFVEFGRMPICCAVVSHRLLQRPGWLAIFVYNFKDPEIDFN